MINACRRSGLSILEYCHRQGLSYHAYRYWQVLEKKLMEPEPLSHQASPVETGNLSGHGMMGQKPSFDFP